MLSVAPSKAESSLERLIKLYNQDELLKEISRGFAHRVASADLQDPEVRDSRTNPHVLEHRIKKQKACANWYKLKYKQELAKKEFLHLLLSDPERITHGDNEDFMRINRQSKARLKSLKTTIEDVYLRLGGASDVVKDRVEASKPGLELGCILSQKIKDTKLELTRIRTMDPNHKKLPISKVNELLEEQDSQLVLLYEQDSTVKAQIAHTKESIALAVKEMERLRPERARVESSLTHYLRARNHQHGEVATLCSWRRTLIDLYSKSIELNEVVAASENELQLVYSSPTPYTLSIIMNPATQRLASARVFGLAVDISEVAEVAVDADDVIGLINGVHNRVADHCQQSSTPREL